ncbi:enoyl-CoA hydratase/isomerase family protein, partial [Flavobacteriaceae bacterium]|nr:enoyl-CoA hydratase/isomerase family protein [Flavobacteriaceae bacterium]
SIDVLDTEVKAFAQQLSTYNPEALQKLKSTFWEGAQHWGELLNERAAISGQLVLSEFTKSQLKKYK